MSVHRNFDETRDLLVFEVTDDVGIADMMNQVLAWFRDPRFSPAAPILVDFSQANWVKMYQEYELVHDAVFSKVREHGPVGPVAFVLKSATERVMMAVIKKAKPWPMEWSYFGERGEAEAWLMRAADANTML